ncbi:hypothetical protein ARMSODRAFT_979149 [Armillaria solidipes]|uniref:F-box domain-containing protein n=1 Tax=Armillaria solidipes TaxID=1076256 RepID=A0A2H3B0A4_9AGAR|nr:hypothetical protein ARMSODRAFT_979149 [Armillaria solidipes]
MPPSFSVLQRSGIDDLPLELFDEIISHLNIRSIKSLSLASSTFHTICFSHIFHTLSFYRRTSSAFLADFKGRAPTPCFRTVELRFVQEDISTSLLPWCTKARTVRISATNMHNTDIFPFMSVLRDLDLSHVSFWVVDDYFRLLGNLPPTLKKLTAHRIDFHRSRPTVYTTVGRGVALEHLNTHTAQDLSMLLRDGCPISLASLRVASVPQCRSHDLKDLIQRAPHLLDLCVDFERIKDIPGTSLITEKFHTRAYIFRSVSLPLPNLKSFSVVDVIDLPSTIIQLLSTPSRLEFLNLTFPLRWLIVFYGLDNLAIALSEQKFCNLKALNLQIMKPLHPSSADHSGVFQERVQRFQHRLEELGLSSKIKFTAKLVHDRIRGVTSIDGRFY